MSKKAILVVSFGTSHHDTRKKTIDEIEKDCLAAFPDVHQRRAFTSGMIMKILRNRDGMDIPNVEEAMEGLIRDGYDDIVLQPTHILNGDEYEKMVRQAKKYEDQLISLRIGAPLLTHSDDYEQLCHIIAEEAGRPEGEALVLMGHGTGHFSDAAYAALEYRFHALGYGNVFVGTVEGYPDFETMFRRIEAYAPGKVVLLPLMVVAGDHAKNDMAGEEDSWKSAFEEAGYETECILRGIGEFPGVRRLYVEHLGDVME
ncbi:MAG: sirohydrochlorin cobaltochelatase [Anaerovoracaceae bacterium]|jgi:sirohydrochlorin cobaltochelatase